MSLIEFLKGAKTAALATVESRKNRRDELYKGMRLRYELGATAYLSGSFEKGEGKVAHRITIDLMLDKPEYVTGLDEAIVAPWYKTGREEFDVSEEITYKNPEEDSFTMRLLPGIPKLEIFYERTRKTHFKKAEYVKKVTKLFDYLISIFEEKKKNEPIEEEVSAPSPQDIFRSPKPVPVGKYTGFVEWTNGFGIHKLRMKVPSPVKESRIESYRRMLNGKYSISGGETGFMMSISTSSSGPSQGDIDEVVKAARRAARYVTN